MRPIHAAASTPNVRPVYASSDASPDRSIDAESAAPPSMRSIYPTVSIETVVKCIQLKKYLFRY